MRGVTDESVAVETVDSEEDEDFVPPIFKPLDVDAKLSYCATPQALEVAPTQDVSQRSDSFKRRFRENYGSPSESISTRHVSGKKIDKKHAQYALSAGMMLGVRECVGGMSDLDNVDDLTKQNLSLEEECLRVEKFKFPAGAYFVSSKMASLPYRYKFKAYAPTIFHRIRDMAGVDKQLFLHSVCGSDAFIEFVSNAKSGQFFFYSNDGRYMIKTQKQEEKDFLRQILPDYYKHLKKNPHSFITQFYGMYRVKIPDLGKSVHFVIMKSVFNTELEIHKIWDLKGSTLGRRAKRGDSVHKDLDILDEGRKICVGEETKGEIMSILKNDAQFLAKMNIMDYSLLVGVHLSMNSHLNAKDDQITKEELKQALLGRTNTPMRRLTLSERNRDESVLEHFMHDRKAYTSEEQQTTYTATNHSYDESDESDGEAANSTKELSINKLTRVLSHLDVNEYIANIPPNPFSSREDTGIESNIGNDMKEIYFAGMHFSILVITLSFYNLFGSFPTYFCHCLYTGIIDILQSYTAKKWGETVMRKSIGNAEKDISCVSPTVYSDRFVAFIDALLE